MAGLRLAVLCGFLLVDPIPAQSDSQAAVALSDSVIDGGESGRPFEVQPILVTATRLPQPLRSTPFALSTIDLTQQRQSSLGVSLDESLRQVPGLFVSNRHNLSQGDRLSMRGIGSRASFGVRGIRILVDDIPLTMPDGQSQLGNLDLTSVGRVEIIRGASSALYGNAGGGVIHFRTRNVGLSGGGGIRLEPRIAVGSSGLRRAQTAISVSGDSHLFFANLTALDRDGYRDHAAARSLGLNFVGRHHLRDGLSVTSVVNLYDAPYLLNPSSLSRQAADEEPASTRFFVRQQGASKQVRQGQLGFTARYASPDSSVLSLTAYGLSRSLLNPIPGRIIDLDRTAFGLRSAYSRSATPLSKPLSWTVGVDLEQQSDSRSEFDNLGLGAELIDTVSPADLIDRVELGDRQLQQDETVLGTGPFVEIRADLTDVIGITLGARYDRYLFEVDDEFLADGVDHSGRRTMTQLSPIIGLSINPGERSSWPPALTLYANYAAAFQTPTTVELGNRPTGVGGFNPDLEPEVVHSREIGLRAGSPSRVECGLALYDVDIEQMLIPFQIGDSEEVFFRNAGRAGSRGGELSLTWRPHRRARLDIAATASNFEFEDFAVETPEADVADPSSFRQLAGNEVPGVAPQSLYAGLNLDAVSGFRGQLDVRWTGDYFANDFNGPPEDATGDSRDYASESFVVVDVRLSRTIEPARHPLEIFAGIDNILGNRYDGSIVPNAFGDRFFEPAPGRSFFVGIGATVGGDLKPR